ncbi:MAG: chitobiase/beta-hexosaminidase C-terminal domain-containing protein, partial [Candidatus Cloacimonetes bacterium]|nr:chitobiase/beta-hexosaminidase C-terminal domain-containing protein [Candidatus Cloacimonadota bacterium]
GDRTLQGYNVYRNGIKINQQVVIYTNYYDYNLGTLEEYYYYVTAVYDSEESIPSNIVYVELENRVATPNFDPIGGYYSEPQQVILSSLMDNVTIRYTLDGDEPNESSPVFVDPISITETTRVKAKGYKDGWLPSQTGEEYYVIMKAPENVTISISGNQINLQWEISEGATSYAIYTSNNIEEDNWELLDITDNTSYLHEITPPLTMGFYRIRAIYGEPVRIDRAIPSQLNR